VTFNTILADPPWPENGGGKIKRGADRHYPTLKVKDIPAVMIRAFADRGGPAPDSHLYLWTTNNYLPGALWVMAELDFRYVTNIAWVKDRFGLGQYFRGGHELCLFGVRGNGMQLRREHTDRRDIKGVLEEEGGTLKDARGKHSAKPLSFYDLVEAASPGPYLEIFARDARPGWSVWGNEAPEQNPLVVATQAVLARQRKEAGLE